MMNAFEYDDEADAAYVRVSSKKAYYSLEVSPRIVVDLSDSNKVVGVEILEASRLLSELLGVKASKTRLKELHCKISETDALYLHFQLDDEKASLALPKTYASPILSVNT